MPGDAPTTYRVTVPAEPDGLEHLHALIDRARRDWPAVDGNDFDLLETAIIELAGNVARHGRPTGATDVTLRSRSPSPRSRRPSSTPAPGSRSTSTPPSFRRRWRRPGAASPWPGSPSTSSTTTTPTASTPGNCSATADSGGRVLGGCNALDLYPADGVRPRTLSQLATPSLNRATSARPFAWSNPRAYFSCCDGPKRTADRFDPPHGECAGATEPTPPT